MIRTVTILLLILTAPAFLTVAAETSAPKDAVAQLAKEVADKGWIAYSARSDNGTWDLFLSRPDGTQRRNISNTPDYEEAAARFSHDGKQMLYRRFPKGTVINHDLWGFQGRLVMANADGSNPKVIGEKNEFAWASWSPDNKALLCLTRKAIQIVDIATKNVLRTVPRSGIYQQLFWSPDGKWFTATGNHGGMQWCVVRMNAKTGDVKPVQRFQSCTPDWAPDSKNVIYSSRPADQKVNKGYGWTQLWLSDIEGKHPRLLYGEEGSHIYGGALSPDSRYILFTKSSEDGAGAEKSGGPIHIMRLQDAPTIDGASEELRSVHPDTKDGPVLQISTGWEPCWTYAEILEGE